MLVMDAREYRTCLIVLGIAVLITIHIQLLAIFYMTDETDEELSPDIGCNSHVEAAFTRNMTTSDEMLMVWRSVPATEDRILAVARNRKNYMAMGCVVSGTATSIASTLDMLDQLVNYTSVYHKLHTVVIVVILDQQSADDVVHKLVRRYLYDINLGFIQLFQQHSSLLAEQACLQIEAMAVIGQYVRKLASHYLHLGSECINIAPDYVESIRDFVQRETQRRRRLTMWTLLEFSTSTTTDDFLGYFMHAVDVDRFAKFFLEFSDSQRVSNHNHTQTLRGIFLDIVTQRVSLRRRPPVFRRRDNPEDAQEDYLQKPWPSADDPPATVVSSMLSAGKHSVDLVYASGGGYFQTSTAAPGDWIAIVFEADITIERIFISTGLSDGSLILNSGFVEVSPRLLKLDVSIPNVVCADFVRVGDVSGKSTELYNIARLVWGRPTRCLRLTLGELSAGAGSEIVIHQIAVFIS